METLIHCIYSSAARQALDSSDLRALLDQARKNNSACGVTGMLLYVDQSFFQVLEGDEAAVDAVYERIKLDSRHHKLTRIIREPISRRAFGQWTMGFAQMSEQDLANLAGVNDFFGKNSIISTIDSGRAKKLLSVFAAGRWRAKISGSARHARASP
jgi:hypothetical protein